MGETREGVIEDGATIERKLDWIISELKAQGARLEVVESTAVRAEPTYHPLVSEPVKTPPLPRIDIARMAVDRAFMSSEAALRMATGTPDPNYNSYRRS